MLLALRLCRRGCKLGHVSLDESPSLGLVQRSAQDGMDLADRRWCEAPLAELRVQSIDLECRQFRQPDSTEHWHDLSVHVQAVVVQRGCGAYAEKIATHERQLLAVPAGIDLVDAAAIPEVFLTAWDALVLQGGLTSGRWALVHAGASGVGTASIQIAKSIGARIAVTCSAGKADACHALGADLVLERSPHDWLSGAKAAVPQGFDTVLDVIGGDEVDRNLQAVALRGTIVQVGLMGGGTTPVNVGLLLAKRATWVGTTLRTRPIEEKVAVTRRFAAEMLPLFDSGALRPVIDSVYAFDDIADAHRHMEANANTGKIVVTIA